MILKPAQFSRYPNWSAQEMACKHTGQHGMQDYFMDALQRIRMRVGRPLVATSGFRHPTHPAESAKARPGAHAYGVAADIRAWGTAEVLSLIDAARAEGITRFGISAREEKGYFLHMDMADREYGFPPGVLWTY